MTPEKKVGGWDGLCTRWGGSGISRGVDSDLDIVSLKQHTDALQHVKELERETAQYDEFKNRVCNFLLSVAGKEGKNFFMRNPEDQKR